LRNNSGRGLNGTAQAIPLEALRNCLGHVPAAASWPGEGINLGKQILG
jgi:hypothetical protein